MIISLVEHKAREALLLRIKQICLSSSSAWGMAIVKRNAIVETYNEEFITSIKPALVNATAATLYVTENGDLHILWLGTHKSIYANLERVVGHLRSENAGDDATITYHDPCTMIDALASELYGCHPKAPNSATMFQKAGSHA